VKYRIRVVRTQVAERFVRATDEDAALEKVYEELARPYGLFVSWDTRSIEVAEVEALPMTIGGTSPVDGGPLLMSIKDAAVHLGIPRSKMYELVSAGEMPSVSIGSRRLVSREALNEFVAQMSRPAR
jgi:excisionase family DNA binding protein